MGNFRQLRSVFKKAIGADYLDKSSGIKEGVTYNEHKCVFQASIKISDQAVVKEWKPGEGL